MNIGTAAADKEKVKKAIQTGTPLTITTYTLPREMDIYIGQLVGEFLSQLDKDDLKDYVVYCIQEMAGNAKKANTKRAYFSEKGLDLSNPEHYKEGMEDFKETTLSNINHYLELQKKLGLYIRVILQIRKNIINIEVRNNVAVTKTELIRIHDKLVRARQYKSMEDALFQVLDDTEGAGLGLVILMLMLKKIGLDEDCFEILSTEKETVARLSIPLDSTRVENMMELSSAIVECINSLPQFPENIISVQKLIENPESEITDIARHISMDPALTADLLKIVNSAHYMLSKKVDNITDAVKMVGMQGLRNLLYSYGTLKLLGEDTPEKKSLWEHSYKTAFFAYNLVRNFSKDSNLLDDAYVGGILHDMGKIVFSNVHPALLERINNFCRDKGLPATTFEDLSAGMNHQEIGAAIAEKWNFPDSLITSIRYHHDPASAPEKFKELVENIYMANMLCCLEKNEVAYDQFDQGVLDNFGFKSKKHVDVVLGKLSDGFKNAKK